MQIIKFRCDSEITNQDLDNLWWWIATETTVRKHVTILEAGQHVLRRLGLMFEHHCYEYPESWEERKAVIADMCEDRTYNNLLLIADTVEDALDEIEHVPGRVDCTIYSLKNHKFTQIASVPDDGDPDDGFYEVQAEYGV